MMIDTELHWLDAAAPPFQRGVTWGVPWPQGAVAADAALTLASSNGQPIPVQSRPLAFWPDGSLKWSGHAALAGPEQPTPLRLSLGMPAIPASPVSVVQTNDTVVVTQGQTVCRIPRSGSSLIEALSLNGRVLAEQGELVCLCDEPFVSRVDTVTVEQDGPVQAVVKIQGVHQSPSRDWLPFTVRLSFHAGTNVVRLMHSFVFDGDQHVDFIRGLGVRFAVPLRDECHNRHVRLAGEEIGLFGEPVQVIVGRRNPSPELYARQVAGQPLPPLADLPLRENIAQMAAWDAYKLTQITSDSFQIHKRTGEQSAWIPAAAGRRARGLGYVGDTGGGLALGLADFWQRAPTAIEVQGAKAETATLTAWLWSPDAPAMDLRHYDVEDHGLEASYEDIQEGYSTAFGIARTSELLLCPFAETPDFQTLHDLARTAASPPHLVCAPERYHAADVFGTWSLPRRTTPTRRWIEDQLDAAIAFYQTQIEQHHWYGFWDYGDVMHSYDSVRHVWRYDLGGMAWANTELMPDLWLWYSFLRTGRADIFRMAEAMTRHTQEVDSYHLGPFVGLGSRHNVRHWGCGCKEARIAQALLKRFLYYLTADERMGDLLDEVVDADFATVAVDPLRKIEPPTEHPTHARVGPDWLAFCSNWFTAWERTGDTRYRDKILVGMKCLAAMPHQFFSGPAYGYDPETGRLFPLYDTVEVPHLAALMGGPELCMEMTPLLGGPEWRAAWLHYCRWLQAPPDEQEQALGGIVGNGRGPHYAKMTAWAARETADPALARRAWQTFLGTEPLHDRFQPQPVDGPQIPTARLEIPRASTNDAAQWSLNAIELLELIGDSLDAD